MIFAVRFEDTPEARRFISETNERLSNNNLFDNPFSGKIQLDIINENEFIAIFDMKPLIFFDILPKRWYYFAIWLSNKKLKNKGKFSLLKTKDLLSIMFYKIDRMVAVNEAERDY
ncbi:hypothetical protein KY315_02465 [Candidatus Woesearchaeota archaeon]|nr:hypothetical protein [Candidatus Woesearchaeota archaeon]